MLKIASSDKGRSFIDCGPTTLQYTINSPSSIVLVHDVKKYYINTTRIYRQYSKHTEKYVYIREDLKLFTFRDLV